jgi:hypothetical protein
MPALGSFDPHPITGRNFNVCASQHARAPRPLPLDIGNANRIILTRLRRHHQIDCIRRAAQKTETANQPTPIRQTARVDR